MQDFNDYLKKEIKEIKSKLEKGDAKNYEYSSAIAAGNASYKILQKENHTLRSQMDKNKLSLERRIDDLKTTIASRDVKIEQLTKSITEHTTKDKDNEGHSSMFGETSGLDFQLQSRYDEIAAELESSKQKLASVNEKLESEVSRRNELHDELDETKQQLASLNDKFESDESKYAIQLSRNNQLNDELDETKQKLFAVTTELVSKKIELDEVKRKLEAEEKEKTDLICDIKQNLTAELVSTKQKLFVSNAQLEAKTLVLAKIPKLASAVERDLRPKITDRKNNGSPTIVPTNPWMHYQCVKVFSRLLVRSLTNHF